MMKGNTGQLESPQLEGVRILDLSSVGPAARASRILADYGAEVIKVSPTRKKGAVQIVPPFHTYGAGRGYQRIRLDLKAPQGREAFLKLAETADVLIESYRPGVVKRLGIDFDAIEKRNPRIIYCSTSGYGQDGPYANWAGHDLNYLAVSGFLACSETRSDGGPPIPGATVADSAGGGMHAVIAILAALVKRVGTGCGQYLDVSAAEGALSLMSLSIDQYLATGEEAGSRQVLLTGRYACYDLYPTQDGKWLSVGAIEAHFFANLCNALGCPEFAKEQYNDAMQDRIREVFRKRFLSKDRDEWVKELAPNDTCIAPVYSIAEVVADPHLRERGIFTEATHSEHGRFQQLAPILAGGVRDLSAHEVRDQSETDVEPLLRAAGYAGDEIKQLMESGVAE